MSKIRLHVEDLHVDTFAVSPEPHGGPGTVHGYSAYLSALPGVLCRDSEDSHFVACTEDRTYGDLGTCQHTVCDCDQADTTFPEG